MKHLKQICLAAIMIGGIALAVYATAKPVSSELQGKDASTDAALTTTIHHAKPIQSNFRFTPFGHQETIRQLEMTYNIDIEGEWTQSELGVLRDALADATVMFGDQNQLKNLIEEARLANGVTADRLTIGRIHEGRATYCQGGAIFQILLGDETFDHGNYADLPLPSRPSGLDLRSETDSAKVTILHELMHVLVDGNREIVSDYRQQRQWETQPFAVEFEPHDGRRSFAWANLTEECGPEEDLVIAMALYAHAYAPDAPETHRLYLELMYPFHMLFVWQEWGLPEPPPGDAARKAALEQSLRSGPECRIRTCTTP